MRITMTEKTTTIEADARELRESNTLADNFAMMLSRCFRSNEPFEDDEDEDGGEHMSDTIDRQAAIDFIDAGHLCNPNEPRWSDNEVVNFLKSRPSAQPEIIRCKDCKHYNAGFECLIEGYGIERSADWYCGDAERRE